MREHPNPNLRFVWVVLPARWDPWDPRRGGRGTKLHYVLWQRRAIREAARLHRDERFDLVHYVSWNTVSQPPPLWRLPIPFVWGSVGGGQTAPPAFRRYFGPERLQNLLRTLRLQLLPLRPTLRRAVRMAALILATNRETARLLVAGDGPLRKVPVTTPSETVAAMAGGIRWLAQHPEARLRMGVAAWAYAATQAWDRRAEQMSVWYADCPRARAPAWKPDAREAAEA